MSQRRRYSDEEKTRWLEEFESVGGSAAAFCEQRGLGYPTHKEIELLLQQDDARIAQGDLI